MIINVLKLPEGARISLEAAYHAEDFELNDVDRSFLSEIRLNGEALREHGALEFKGTMNADVREVCARCLSAREIRIEHIFDLSYLVKGDETIDTTPDLRDIWLLDTGDRVLCHSDCKGICANCGTNLNTGNCSCHDVHHSVTHKMEDLRNWFKERK